MRRPKAAFSKIDLGNGLGRWNTIPTRRRSATTSVAGSSTLAPETSTSPRVRTPGIRSFIRLKALSSVLLPQPDGPMIAVTRFEGTARVMSLSAC